MKAKFKENTFVKGTYDELMEMAKAIEEKGAKVLYNGDKKSNHLWWSCMLNLWSFTENLSRFCDHELTKSQLYEAYGIVDFSILNESDVFYVETINDKYLIQGKHPFEIGERILVVLSSDSIFTDNNSYFQSDKSKYKLIRLATPQEIEPYKEHFKLNNMKKQPKFKIGNTVRCIEIGKLGTSPGWEEGKEFIVGMVKIGPLGVVYSSGDNQGVWEESLKLVSRPIQISQETATEWFNSTDETLKRLALTAYPELDEATPKVGDLCLFSNDEEQFNSGFGVVGVYEGCKKDGLNECKNWGTRFKYCKKIKNIEFHD